MRDEESNAAGGCGCIVLLIALLYCGWTWFGKDSDSVTTKYEGNFDSINYYESGNIRDVINEVEGSKSIYYEYGELKSESLFKDDKLEGIVKTYYKNGKLETEKSYKDGRLEGISKVYNRGGALKAVIIYREGVLLEGKCHNERVFGKKELKDIAKNLTKALKFCE